MLLSKSLEILFRGALASYLLLFALDIKTYPARWATPIANLNYYAQRLSPETQEIAPEWLEYYCQWLVLCSLLIVSGMRTGKAVAWVAVAVNLAVCWSELEALFIGKGLIMQVCTRSCWRWPLCDLNDLIAYVPRYYIFFGMFKRADSAKDYSTFLRIKDLHYFKLLLSSYDTSIVKDYFLHSLETIVVAPHSPYQLQRGYCYVAGEDIDLRVQSGQQLLHFKQGYLMQDCDVVILVSSACVLYRIARKTEVILKKLFFLDLAILRGLKNSEKLLFYELCSVLSLDFGRFIYKKGDGVQAIYCILEGQVKILKRRKEKIIEIGSLEKERIFGSYEFKQERQTRQLFAKASQNLTEILAIPKAALERLCEFKQSKLEKILEQVPSELSCTFLMHKKKQRAGGEHERPKQKYSLEKRVKGYQKDHFIQNSLLEDLAHSKTLFHKVNDLTKISKFRAQDFKILLNTASDVKHFNDKWKRTKELNRHTVTSPSNADLFTSASLKRSFVGLHRYPSVKEYQSKRSKMANSNLFQ